MSETIGHFWKGGFKIPIDVYKNPDHPMTNQQRRDICDAFAGNPQTQKTGQATSEPHKTPDNLSQKKQ